MADLTIPSLSLFQRSPSRHKKDAHRIATGSDHSICDVLMESQKINRHNLIPQPARAVPRRDVYEDQARIVRCQRQIDYLDSLRHTLPYERPLSSLQSTLKHDSPRTFGASRPLCECESPPRIQPMKHLCQCQSPPMFRLRDNNTKVINNKNNLHSKPMPVNAPAVYHPPVRSASVHPPSRPVSAHPQIVVHQRQPQVDHMIQKDAYISRKEQKPVIHPLGKKKINITYNDPRFIRSDQNVNTSRVIQPSESIRVPVQNIAKFIREDRNVNKSVLVNESLRPRAEIEVQTEEPAVDRSSFIISRFMQKVPQIMDEQNFKKAIKDLNMEISSLKIDLSAQDIFIDLSDLILTKDQYIQESRGLLNKLMHLSKGVVVEQTKKKTKGGIVWPEGV